MMMAGVPIQAISKAGPPSERYTKSSPFQKGPYESFARGLNIALTPDGRRCSGILPGLFRAKVKRLAFLDVVAILGSVNDPVRKRRTFERRIGTTLES